MSTAFVASEIEVLVYWIEERERVRQLKARAAPKPWTKDELLRDYRWCNVCRMDDRVSVELMRDWYSDSAPATQLVAACLGRLVNWPEALLDATGGKPFAGFSLEHIRAALQARAARGDKVFTGAYVVPGVPGRNKVDSVLDLAGRVDHLASTILQSTLRGTWEALVAQDGLGSFLAGQIVADLAHLSCGRAWPDGFTWAPVGPGSERGMNRVRGRPKSQKISQAQFDRELQEYIELMRSRVPAIDADRRLTAQCYQSTLCEGDKYFRLRGKEGTVRARYDGRGVTAAATAQAALF